MIAFLDAPSGISGDMFLGCLVDAGWPLSELHAVVTTMGLSEDDWRITQTEVMRGPLRATLVDVEAHEGHVHRHLSDIRTIINETDLSPTIKANAIAVFTRLAEAEAEVHGMPVESVHFHEVGAIDAIIDIVGVCAGIEALGIQRLYAGSLPLGPGWTQSAHGRIPLPAPATLNLLAAANAATRPAPGPGELVTPTGAALICELANFSQPPMRLEKIAIGAGQKEFEWPNIARLWLGKPESPPRDHSPHGKKLIQIETNIDDMNPEFYGHVVDQLFAAGALDVWMTPIQMKKQRPGTLLGVLARSEDEDPLSDLILRETTTLGVRIHSVHRHEAERELRTVNTEWGPVRVKLKFVGKKLVGIKPEHDDCRQLATENEIALQAVYETAKENAKHQWTENSQ
jgi:uncharacterized protein (TIGR00299 family) protein